MAKLHFMEKNFTIDMAEGSTLAEGIRAAGFTIETPCNGSGGCGKCKVKVWGEVDSLSVAEKELLQDPDMRLSCQTRIYGETWLELPTASNWLQTVNKGLAIDVELDCSVKLIELPIPTKSARPYLAELPFNYDSADIYRKAGELERTGAMTIYGVVDDGKLLDLGAKPWAVQGAAIDIGTTGISAYLIDLMTGETLGKVSCLNPQTQFGGDVLSRISYCLENDKGTHLLQLAIIKAINELINKLTANTGGPNRVYRVAIAGNPTMLHFLLGVFPGSIARAPYRPVFLDSCSLKAGETGIEIGPNGLVTLLPSASAYIGADILAGIAATAFERKEHAAVFLDIGTNGEVVANLGGRLIATSTAAGPALEGMAISWGCRAEEGAIDTFSIDDDYGIHFTTVGGAKPIGICGSGLIDVMAALVEREIVLPGGRFNPKLDSRAAGRLRNKRFYLNEDIYISQSDIRQIQLAKGAISAGFSMLLDQAGVGLSAIEEVVIAGAFGFHINPDSLKLIGLLPKGFNGRITFAGNSAVEGARLALINRQVLEQICTLPARIEVLELSTSPRFQDYFVQALGF